MKILLAEDEASVAAMMHKGLTEKGYKVTVAPDGNLALNMAINSEYDLVIIDVMLPGINGIELCRQLRKNDVLAPVLMVTALGTTENIVTGLDSGADDYMVKPFRLAELEARIRSLLRRSNNATTTERVTIADLVVDFDAKIVMRSGKEIVLTATEFRLLECLLRSRNRVLSRAELLEKVWGVDFNMATNVVDVYVNYLRKKVDKDYNNKLIHTVVGMGYMMKEQ